MTFDHDGDAFDLRRRAGLPRALRAGLLAPDRPTWEAGPLTAMAEHWLGIHRSLRTETEALATVLRHIVDGTGSPDPVDHTASRRLAGAIGRQLLGHTEAHHTIEDTHYFPGFVRAFPQLDRAIGLLDADHHVIEETLGRMADGVAALGHPGADRDRLGRLLDDTTDFAAILGRHLDDEEDIVVPVLLRMR